MKERLMLNEAWRNFTEMYESMDKDHALEVFYKLRELQLEENKKDET
tara:strand:+ start:140 stop:280 length:141 start_codon:yes stop_codon:yes gene_type:complete